VSTWWRYDATVERTERQTQKIAAVLAEHAEGVLRTSRAVADHVRDIVAHDSAAFDGSEHAWRRLRGVAANLPEDGDVWILDRLGRVVLATAAFPAQRADFSRRAFFTELAAGASAHIGPVASIEPGGPRYFTIGQRIEDADGRFRGAVVVGIKPRYIEDFYRQFDLGGDRALAIFHEAGFQLARFPAPAEYAGGGSPFMARIGATPQGTFSAPGPVDGVVRIWSFVRVGQTPLIAAAGISREAVLDRWRQHMVVNIGALAALLLVLGVLWRRGSEALTHAAAQTAALQRANEAIRASNRRLHRRRTLLKAALAERESLQREAERANLAKSRFLAAASHDLRQPLQALSLFIELMAMKASTEEQARIAARAKEALASQQSLLGTLMHLSALEAQKTAVAVAVLPAADILERLAAEFEPQFADAGLRFSWVRSSAWVESDPVLLERMLRNLLVNALRYTRHGGVVLGCRRPRGAVRFEVWDSGPGIPADRLEMIFDEFTQLHGASRGESKGLGLGLSIVARTARLLGHETGVRSWPGRGSAFSITVAAAGPQVVAAAGGVQAPA